jgi:hypothetical protein
MLAYTLDGQRANYRDLFILGAVAGPPCPQLFYPDVWHRRWGTAVMEGNKFYYGQVASPSTSIVKGMRAVDGEGDLHASFFLIFQEVAGYPEALEDQATGEWLVPVLFGKA